MSHQVPPEPNQNLDISNGATVKDSQIVQAGNDAYVSNYVTNNFYDRNGRLIERDRQEYLDRQRLLKNVRHAWKDVLASPLCDKTPLSEKALVLSLEERPSALASPWQAETDDPVEQPCVEFPQGTSLTSIFQEMGSGRTLLILGEAGSGKTIALLQLADDLITQAENDLNCLIPVVLNLSSWKGESQSIEHWIQGELNGKYGVPPTRAKQWIHQRKLLLLLDGLDEVRLEDRKVCIEKLNAFRKGDYQAEMVICSRKAEYEVLGGEYRLEFQKAVYIHLLTSVQIDHYLDSLETNLSGLRALILEDPVFQELSQSPLMLNIMTFAYQGMAAEEVPRTEQIEERKKHLFNSYVDRMFHRPVPQRFITQYLDKQGKRQYSNEKTKRWLGWLAIKMLPESQTFLIERMQPFWLETNLQKWIYVLATPLNIVFLVAVNYVFTVQILEFQSSYSAQYPQIYSSIKARSLTSPSIFYISLIPIALYSFIMAYKLILEKPFFLFQWSKMALKSLTSKKFISNTLSRLQPLFDFYHVYYRLLLRNYIVPDIKPVETVSWSFSSATRTLKRCFLPQSLLLGILGIIINLIIFFLVFIYVVYRNYLHSAQISFTTIVAGGLIGLIIMILLSSLGIIFGFIEGVFLSLFLSPLLFCLGGISVETEVERTIIPNQGIWRSMRNAVTLGVLGAAMAPLLRGSILISQVPILFSVHAQREALSEYWMRMGLAMVLGQAFTFGLIALGPCTKHLILRVILYCSGCLPWNYAHFLDYAADRIFLHKVGGGYIFIHRLLMEHFAAMDIQQD
jgi:hypothetical protein